MPTTDYTDPMAVIAALTALSDDLSGSGRVRPVWHSRLLRALSARTTAAVMAGANPAQAAEYVLDACFMAGVLAGREGWPLVGDVAP